MLASNGAGETGEATVGAGRVGRDAMFAAGVDLKSADFPHRTHRTMADTRLVNTTITR